jgi:hypothetical protein
MSLAAVTHWSRGDTDFGPFHSPADIVLRGAAFWSLDLRRSLANSRLHWRGNIFTRSRNDRAVEDVVVTSVFWRLPTDLERKSNRDVDGLRSWVEPAGG